MNKIQNKKVLYSDLGRMDYLPCWDYQEQLVKDIIEKKLQNRTAEIETITPNYLLFVEHPHVYTLGKSGNEGNLLANKELLEKIGASYIKSNRGGDITYHGPGQLVGYPILDLENFFTDIHRYMRCLEEVIIRTIANFGLKGERSTGETGVWLDVGKPYARKICAMGVKASRWVTLHGFALNVNTDLKYFEYIVPCGIRDKSVTSLQRELQQTVDINIVKSFVKKHFAEVFEAEFE